MPPAAVQQSKWDCSCSRHEVQRPLFGVGREPEQGISAGFHIQMFARWAPEYLPLLLQQLWPVCLRLSQGTACVQECASEIYEVLLEYTLPSPPPCFESEEQREGSAGGSNVLGCHAKNLRLVRCNVVQDVCLKMFATYSGSCEGQITAFILPVCRS